jgi:hypothetical protein
MGINADCDACVVVHSSQRAWVAAQMAGVYRCMSGRIGSEKLVVADPLNEDGETLDVGTRLYAPKIAPLDAMVGQGREKTWMKADQLRYAKQAAL